MSAQTLRLEFLPGGPDDIAIYTFLGRAAQVLLRSRGLSQNVSAAHYDHGARAARVPPHCNALIKPTSGNRKVVNRQVSDSAPQTSMPLKPAISSGCESRPANRSLGRKQPER
jgi:hypothetical protein